MHAGKRTDPERTVLFMNEFLKRYQCMVRDIAQWLGISENQVYNWRGGKIGFKKVHLLAMMACTEFKYNSSLNVIADPYGWVDSVDEKFEELCLPMEDAIAC